MRKALVFLIGLLTLAVAVAACSGSKSNNNGTPTPSPSPSPSPTPAGPFNMTLGATNWPHGTGDLRVIETNGGMALRAVVFCTAMTAMPASWSVTTDGIFSSSNGYRIELFGDLGTTGHNQWTPGTDHSYAFIRNAGSTSNMNIIFDHNATPNNATLEWTANQGCPGG